MGHVVITNAEILCSHIRNFASLWYGDVAVFHISANSRAAGTRRSVFMPDTSVEIGCFKDMPFWNLVGRISLKG